MGDRFYCTIHRKTMTGSRMVHSGEIARRCEDCVAVARAKVRSHIAAYQAEVAKDKAEQASCP